MNSIDATRPTICYRNHHLRKPDTMKAIKHPFATLKKGVKHRLGAKKRASTVDETILASRSNDDRQKGGADTDKRNPYRRGTYGGPMDVEITQRSESGRT